MDKKLRNILSKLVESKPAGLTEEELAHIDRMLHPQQAKSDQDARPLWYWMRKQVFLHEGMFDWYLDPEIDPILVDAGADIGTLPYDAEERRRLAEVSGEGLRRAVRRHLTHQNVNTRAHAARLIGLCELTDCAPLLIDSMETAREDRSDGGAWVIAATLQALGMLRHPMAARFAAKYVSHDDYTLKRAAQCAFLLSSESYERAVFQKLLGGTFEPRSITTFPDAFVWAAREGIYDEESLKHHLDSLYLDVHGLDVIADIVVSAKWTESYQRLLERDGQFRCALALRVAWTDERWTIPMLQARLQEEEDDEARMVMITALGSFGEEQASLVRASFQSDRPSDWVGATWSAVGRPEWRPELQKLLKDPDYPVRRAASCVLALAAEPASAELVELKWTELLNIDNWWPWAVPAKAIRQAGVPLPHSLRGFGFISDELRGNRAYIEEALEFFAAHPIQLLRWLGPTTPEDQRRRAAAFAGMIGGEQMAGALELALSNATSLMESTQAYRDLVVLGGPTNPVAELKGLLTLEREPRAPEGSTAAALVYAYRGDMMLRERATKSLAGAAREVEPFVAMLLEQEVDIVAQSAADLAGHLVGAHDPYLSDVAKLMTGEARSLEDLSTADWLVSSQAPKVRSRLAEIAGRPGNERSQAMPYLLRLAVDRNPEVAAVALGSIAIHAGGEGWVRDLLLQNTWSDDYFTKEKAVQAIVSLSDPVFVPRLVELTGDQQNFGAAEASVRGLIGIADAHPELGLTVLDIRQPHRVVDRYGLNTIVDYSADEHSEALRLLMLALEDRRDAAEAAKQVGRKVMLTPASGGFDTTPTAARWSARLFEQLCLHLKVVFADEDSGAIIAEVDASPSGEILSALLQTSSVSVTTVAWS